MNSDKLPGNVATDDKNQLSHIVGDLRNELEIFWVLRDLGKEREALTVDAVDEVQPYEFESEQPCWFVAPRFQNLLAENRAITVESERVQDEKL